MPNQTETNWKRSAESTWTLQQYKGTLSTGMIPISRANNMPFIIAKWRIPHTYAPAFIRGAMFNYVWVPSWFVLLTTGTGLSVADITGNAWTTVQENKTKVLELKIAYDRALLCAKTRLLTLSTFLISPLKPGEKYAGIEIAATDFICAVEADQRRAQLELEAIEP